MTEKTNLLKVPTKFKEEFLFNGYELLEETLSIGGKMYFIFDLRHCITNELFRAKYYVGEYKYIDSIELPSIYDITKLALKNIENVNSGTER